MREDWSLKRLLGLPLRRRTPRFWTSSFGFLSYVSFLLRFSLFLPSTVSPTPLSSPPHLPGSSLRSPPGPRPSCPSALVSLSVSSLSPSTLVFPESKFFPHSLGFPTSPSPARDDLQKSGFPEYSFPPSRSTDPRLHSREDEHTRTCMYEDG